MGKAKKRSLNRIQTASGGTIKREEIIKKIINDIKRKEISTETKSMISLFGILPEELSESGATIEELSIFNKIL